MVQIYVAKNGNNATGNGSSVKPYLTIAKAVEKSTAGDEIIVRAGTYKDEDSGVRSIPGIAPKSGTTIRAENVPKLNGTTWSAPHTVIIDQTQTIQFGFVVANRKDVTISGFEIKNARDVNVNFGGDINVGHTLKNCKVHHCNGNGVSSSNADRITIEGNEVYNCAEMTRPDASTAQSGISLLRNQVQAGPDLADGYRTHVVGNYCHHNKPDGGKTTDGNGIIIDKFHYFEQKYGTAKTLVARNICAFNRGAGIRLMASKHVTVEHNTGYGNGRQTVPHKAGCWGGEIQAQWSQENTIRYNIGVATEGGDAANTKIGGFGNNGGPDPQYTATQPGTGNTIIGNIFVGILKGKDQNVSPGFQTAASSTNKIGVNPLLVDPENGNYQTKAGSPARKAAAGGLDIGAWQSGA